MELQNEAINSKKIELKLIVLTMNKQILNV